jgi:hypothetical protein
MIQWAEELRQQLNTTWPDRRRELLERQEHLVDLLKKTPPSEIQMIHRENRDWLLSKGFPKDAKDDGGALALFDIPLERWSKLKRDVRDSVVNRAKVMGMSKVCCSLYDLRLRVLARVSADLDPVAVHKEQMEKYNAKIQGAVDRFRAKLVQQNPPPSLAELQENQRRMKGSRLFAELP